MDNLVERLRDAQALTKLIGQAPTFLKTIQPLADIAKSEANVLLTGERGTGKTLVARAIHYMSARAAYPFISVPCGSLPDGLKESELFRHKGGAVADASTQSRGLALPKRRKVLCCWARWKP